VEIAFTTDKMEVTATILDDFLQLVCSTSNIFDTDSGDFQQ